MINKVLIIEDELDIRFLLKQFFKSRGIEVMEASSLLSAQEQIDKIDEHTLVTLDLQLPDGNGFTFLEKLKKLEKKCKILVCSAYSDLAQKALSLGADGFMEKPVTMKNLDEFICNA